MFKKEPLYKTRIFFGDTQTCTADDSFNDWYESYIEEHPKMNLLNMQYQQVSKTLHSIMILYTDC